MNPLIRPTLLAMSILCMVVCLAQDLKFEEIRKPDGKPIGFLTGITQDSYGNLWYTSNGSLTKYDGKRFTSYFKNAKDSNSLISPRPECVYADRQGYIWIGTWSGLDRLDPSTGTFKHFLHTDKDPYSLSGYPVTAILEDSKGRLWVGTHSGLDLLDRNTGRFTLYQHDKRNPHSLSNNQVRVIYEDHSGVIWVGCGSTFTGETPEGEGGLNRLDAESGTFTSYLHDPHDNSSLIDNRVRSIFEDSHGNFWVGTGLAGFHHMDRATGKMQKVVSDPLVPGNPIVLRTPSDFPFVDVITSIREDATGALWVNQFSHGPTRWDPKNHEVRHYESEKRQNGFINSSTWLSLSTKDDLFWISTWGESLFKLDPTMNGVKFHDLSLSVLSIMMDGSEVNLMSTYTGMFYMNREDDKITHSFVFDPQNKRSIANTLVQSAVKDEKGRIWVGTADGFDLFEGVAKGFRHYKHDPNDSTSFLGSGISSLLLDRSGNIWIAMNDGLDRFDPGSGKFTHYLTASLNDNSIPRSYVTCLGETPEGEILAGQWESGGLKAVSPKTGHVRHLLQGYSLNTIFRDGQGVYWIGTDQGIMTSKDLVNFSTFAPPEFNNEVIQAVAFQEDGTGRIWASTLNNMILVISRDRKQVRRVNRAYGVFSTSFNANASTKDKNGKIYFGTANGYYEIDPVMVTANPRPPLVTITGFQTEDRSATEKRKAFDLTKAGERGISLSFDQNTFRIGFSVIHFGSPQDNQTFYMLVPYDLEWRDAVSADNARYAQLPPGTYTFRLKGISSSGIIVERSLSINIAPPWWRSWWAYLLYGLLGIVLVFMVDRIQKRRILTKEREKNRAREMAQAKEIEKAYHELKATQSQLVHAEKMASLGELTAGIAHEIQNPLNFINNFTEVNCELLDEFRSQHAGEKAADGQEIIEDPLLHDIEANLDKINHHGKRADSIVKSMLQHARTGTGQKESTDLNRLIEEHLRLSYHAIRATVPDFNPTLHWNLDADLPEISIVPQEIGRVALNLFNNAFHALIERQKVEVMGYQPTLSVSIQRHQDRVEIRISDNGTGMPEQVRSKIFQPFFTTKPTGQGTGLGLSLSFDIIRSHSGTIEVDSALNKGSTFTLYLPM